MYNRFTENALSVIEYTTDSEEILKLKRKWFDKEEALEFISKQSAEMTESTFDRRVDELNQSVRIAGLGTPLKKNSEMGM